MMTFKNPISRRLGFLALAIASIQLVFGAAVVLAAPPDAPSGSLSTGTFEIGCDSIHFWGTVASDELVRLEIRLYVTDDPASPRLQDDYIVVSSGVDYDQTVLWVTNADGRFYRVAISASLDDGDTWETIASDEGIEYCSAVEDTQNLSDDVDDLVAQGSLKAGQGNGLTRPLRNAIRSLEKGKLQPACSQLQDFIDEVNQKVADGVLTQAEGDALIASANAIRDAAGCTP